MPTLEDILNGFPAQGVSPAAVQSVVQTLLAQNSPGGMGNGGGMLAANPAQAMVAQALAQKNTAGGDEAAYDAALAGGAMTPQDTLRFKTNARRLGYSDDSGAGPGVMPTGLDDRQDFGRKPPSMYPGTDIPNAKRLVEYGNEDTRDPALKYKTDGTVAHPPGSGVQDLFRQQPPGSSFPGGQPVPYRKAGLEGPDPLVQLASMVGGEAPLVTRMAAAETVPATKETVPTVGKNLTEAQSKDTVFTTRAVGALPLLDKYGTALTDWAPEMAGKLPFGWGSGMQSADYQRAEQAGQEFLSALLRKDTGATITPDEQAYYAKMYLPQPGNKPELLEQKRAARSRAVMAMQLGLPPEVIVALEKAGMSPVVPSATKPRDDLKSKYGLE